MLFLISCADESGSINSQEEMAQLCLSLLFKLGISTVDEQCVDSAWVRGMVDGLPPLQDHPMDLEAFQLYFKRTYYDNATF